MDGNLASIACGTENRSNRFSPDLSMVWNMTISVASPNSW
jgi:hypothetical protein